MDGTKASAGIIILSIMTSFVFLAGCSKTSNTLLQLSRKAQLETENELSVQPQRAALVNVELGLGYLAQGQIARAKTKLTHALQLAPEATETHSAYAYFLERIGDVQDAEKEYKKAVKYGQATNEGTVYNNYGAFLCRQARFHEADDAFHHALSDKHYARTAEVYENAGVCALKGSQVQKAEDYLLKAVRQDPSRSTALLELTNLSLKQNNLQQAKMMLENYKKVAEPSARSLWLGIQLSHALQDKDGLASNTNLLKNLFEDSPEYQQYMKSDIGNS